MMSRSMLEGICSFRTLFKFAWLLLVIVFITSQNCYADTVTVSPSTLTVGQSTIVTWSDFTSNVNVKVYKGSTWEVDASIDQPSSGSQVLDTTGWEPRSDYRVGIELRVAPFTITYSNYFSVSPYPPTLISPSNSSSLPVGSNITFTWMNSSVDVTNSSIKICENSLMTLNCQFSETGLTSTIRSDSFFTPGQTYYWQARSKTADSDWGIYGPTPAWTFTVDSPAPAPPTLNSPSNGSSLPVGSNVTFIWTNSSVDVTNSSIKICENSSMILNCQFSETGLTSTIRSDSFFTPGQTYYWQARSKTADSDWGIYGPAPAWTFQIEESSNSMLFPANGSTVTSKEVVFDWDDVPGAVSYEILVDNNSGFGSPEVYEPGKYVLPSLTNSGYTVTNWFDDNVYYWKVIVHFADGSTQELDTFTFTYQLAPETKPVWVPFYRYYKGSPDWDHFYTTSPTQGDDAINAGYAYERIEHYISDRKFPESLPLFRLHNPSSQSHFYTSDEVEKDEMLALNGFQYEGIQGYVYASAAQGGVPLYRFRKTESNGDHFFLCARETEYLQVLDNVAWGFVDDGVAGYVHPAGTREPEAHTKPQGNYKGVDLATLAYRTGSSRPDLSLAGRGPDLVLSHHYNSFNFLRLPMGPGWSHSLYNYLLEDANHQFVIVKWGSGAETSFVYDSDSASYVAEEGSYLSLERVDDGINEGYDLETKEGSQFQFRKLTVSASSPIPGIYLTNISDKNGNSLTYEWEASRGQLQSVTDVVGRYLDFSYDDPNNIDLLTGVSESALNRSVSFGYDADGRLESFTDANGQVITYSYNDNDLLTEIKEPRQNKLTVEYNTDGTAKTVQEGNIPQKTVFTRTPEGYLDVTTANGKLLGFAHSGYALIQQVDAYGKITELKRTEQNDQYLLSEIVQRPKIDGGPGETTQYDYDTSGNVTKTTNDLGLTSELEYNDANNPHLVTRMVEFHASGQTGIVTDFIYDTKGNLTDITNALGENVHYTYTTQGLVQSVTDGLGKVGTYDYDTRGNLKKVTDPENNETEYEHDAAGRLLWQKDPMGHYTYFEPDANDNVVETKNNRQFTVNTDYDVNNNLKKVHWSKGGILSETTYSFYPDVDRLQTVQNPLGLTTSYSYYPAGEVASVTDPENQAKLFVYNDNGRLEETGYPDLTKVRTERYDNDLVKSVKTLSSAGATLLDSQFAYDDLNRLQSFTGPYGKQVQYTYDDSGRLKTLIYPGTNKTVTYGYDAVGRLETVSDWVGGQITYNYDAAGNLKQITRPNATIAIYTYDQASHLTGIEEKQADGTVICSYAYGLDKAGNITSISANEPLTGTVPNINQSYTHDKANRLLSAGTKTFTYDDNGNRESQVDGGVTTNYSWNYENMLTQVADGTNTTQYIYDGMNNRIARIENSLTTRYILDLSGDMSKVLCETDGVGNVTAYYIYGLGLVSRIDAGNSRRFYHYSNRGDIISLTNDSGSVTDTYAYGEYGGLLEEGEANSISNPFKFVGRYGVMDEGNDFYFMRARFYDAGVGRFLSEDPLGFVGGDWNVFVYSKNDPRRLIDPLGLNPDIVTLTLDYDDYGNEIIYVSEDPLNRLSFSFDDFAYVNDPDKECRKSENCQKFIVINDETGVGKTSRKEPWYSPLRWATEVVDFFSIKGAGG